MHNNAFGGTLEWAGASNDPQLDDQRDEVSRYVYMHTDCRQRIMFDMEDLPGEDGFLLRVERMGYNAWSQQPANEGWCVFPHLLSLLLNLYAPESVSVVKS